MALVAGTMPRRYGRYHKKTKKWISPSFWGVFAHMAYLPIGVARLMNSGPLLDFGALHSSQFGGKKKQRRSLGDPLHERNVFVFELERTEYTVGRLHTCGG